jgi:hypothetical protein
VKPAPQFYTSHLSRFCADELPGDFHYLDGDEVLLRYSSQPLTYARASNTLRICESKRLGEELRRSQREVLPLLAEAIALSVNAKLLNQGSGVFIIEGEPPYSDGAAVSQVLAPSTSRAVGLRTLGPQQLTRDEIEGFIRCRFQIEVAA